ncbi:helix-turn-helix domain-containing protein [Clostridium chromiireducens]|nr:helix-turn-helix transcriptional regulator [Clostridium chromiireducens]
MTFGEFVKERRKEKDISLRSLASRLNISPSYMSDMEKGRRNAYKDLNKLFSALELVSDDDRDTLYKLAADTRDTIPEDVILKIKENPELIDFIRKYNNKDSKISKHNT